MMMCANLALGVHATIILLPQKNTCGREPLTVYGVPGLFTPLLVKIYSAIFRQN